MKKDKVTRSLLAACSIVALTAVMYGCVHDGGSDAPPADDMTDVTPEPAEPPAPTDLETTQEAAAAAATAAMTASDNAAASAKSAMDATADLATLQTNEMARGHAMKADKYAGMAKAEAGKAKDASDAAAAATLASAAGAAKANAEAAQKAAEDAAKMAADYAMKASDAAKMELMIDGTMKSVGDSMVDAMAGASDVSTGSGDDAKRVITGLIKSMNPMATGAMITGQPFAAGEDDDLSTATDESTADTPYRQAAAARTFAIGKVLDSSDDMARLMLITKYAGTNLVKVYSPLTGTELEGTKAGYLTIDDGDDDNTDTNNTALRTEGMFVPVSGDTPGELAATDSVGEMAKAVEVFSYVPPTGATSAGVRQYATLKTTSKTGDTTTYTYESGHDITGVTGKDGPDEGTDPDESQITAGIPGPVAYKHLHFGVWASLGEADKMGMQKIADLGIGFVQSIGDGMTGADMPSTDDAMYKGNWVATVQSTDATGGTTSLDNGAAMLTADFDKATIKADLDGLAMLEGTISGSGFSGMKASSIEHSSLAAGGSYEGSFSGGFYGSKAAEAGGIFDFTSESSGAFTGAFGGAKEKK